MIARLALAALAPLALGDYSYSYETEAPSAAPTSSMAPTSANGARLAVGAPQNGNFAGHVRVFEFDGATWNQLGADIDREAFPLPPSLPSRPAPSSHRPSSSTMDAVPVPSPSHPSRPVT